METSIPFKTILSTLVALAAMGVGSSWVSPQKQSHPAAEAASQAMTAG
jgi:hypothetical protein